MKTIRIAVAISVIFALLLSGCSNAPEKPLEAVVAYVELASITSGDRELVDRFVKVSANESVVSVDTNPTDMVPKTIYDIQFLLAQKEVGEEFIDAFNEILGVSELTKEIISTKKEDGTVTKKYRDKGVKITWCNNGTAGLEVKYEALK